jgi:lysophospholipase L1-like esterase
MRLILVLFLTAVYFGSCAQQEKPPFWNDIQEFKKQDQANPPKPNQILFTGSSSFTMWRDVQSYFPGYPILNRGFGGSSLPDVIRYTSDIIFPYQPKQVVLYIGENDFAANDTVSVETVFNRFKQLYSLIRSRYPDVPVAYVSMKPSPSRKHLWPKFIAANKKIEDFLGSEKNAAFVNVYDKMLKPDGRPLDGLFLEDQLHMTPRGYVIWQKEIERHLVK